MIDEASLNSLLVSASDTRSRALALSTSIPHAGDWLNVIPSPALGFHIQDREFRFCLQYWLGLPMFANETQCPICHLPADRFGDHQVGCGGNSDRIHRHNVVRGVLFSAAQSAALAPRQEAPALIPGSQSRPADFFPAHLVPRSSSCPGYYSYISTATSHCSECCLYPGPCIAGGGGS